VPDVNPAPAEKAHTLLLEAFRIGERAPIHAEQSSCLIIHYVSGVRFLHVESPRDTPPAAFASLTMAVTRLVEFRKFSPFD
jgi:hypothetical protein